MAAAALRELLLAIERTKQPLDAPITTFADAAAADARVLHALVDVHAQAQQLFLIWPDESGKGTRWEQRESIARFLELTTRFLHVLSTERNATSDAEAVALRIVRDKSASLEKLLSWSDKPLVACRVLELLTAIVRTSAAAARELVRVFNFQGAVFAKMAARRLKKPVTDTDGPKPTPTPNDAATDQAPTPPPTPIPLTPAYQLRRAYVALVAAMGASADKSVHRFALKDNGVVASLFKSVDGDDADTLALVLAHLDELVLRHKTLDTRARTAIVNAFAVQQLVAIVKTDGDDAVTALAWRMLQKLFFDDEALYVLPASYALRLLLLKTSPANAGTSDDAVTEKPLDGVRHTAKVIRGVLGAVTTTDYVRSESVRRLVDRFVAAYPGLVAEVIGALPPQLEPKPGFRWFAIASMVQRLLAAPLDAVAHDLATPLGMDSRIGGGGSGGGGSSYSAAVLASKLVLPVNCRKELSRGLQHSSNLVVFASLGLVECALRRFVFVATHLPVGVTRAELETELRFLLPSPEALVSLLMKLCASAHSAALVYLRGLTVFRLYLSCLPQAMGEVKADYTKLLAWDVLDTTTHDANGLRGVIVGELLRILLAIDESRLQYLVVNDSTRSKLSQLLALYVSSQAVTASQVIHVLVRGVLQRVLSALRLFGAGPALEIDVWLDAMPSNGADVKTFVELLLQEVAADPFAFLSDGDSASVASPATLALVVALSGQLPKFQDLRQRASVVAFGTRVLLTLLVRSEQPTQLAHALLATDKAGSVGVPSSVARASKKRRRNESIDLPAAATPFQRVMAIAQRLVSPASTRIVLDSDGLSCAKWKPAPTVAVFLDALFDLHAPAFATALPAIVDDLLRLGLPSSSLHGYIGAHPELDLAVLVGTGTTGDKKEATESKAKTKEPLQSPVVRDLLGHLPLHLWSQRLLFLCAVGSTGADVERVANYVVSCLKALVASGHEDDHSNTVSLVAEQLLVATQLLPPSDAEATGGKRLVAEAFLLAIVLARATVSDHHGATDPHTERLQLKVRAMAASLHATEATLSAVALVASSSDPLDFVTASKRPGAVVEAVLRMPQSSVHRRLAVLKCLLPRSGRQGPAGGGAAAALVLCHLLRTFEDQSVPRLNASVSQRLWALLNSLRREATVSDSAHEQLRVLSAGLHLLHATPGDVVEPSTPATWTGCVQHVVKAPAHGGDAFHDVVVFVRRLVRLGATHSQHQQLVSAVVNDLKAQGKDTRTNILAGAALVVATAGSDLVDEGFTKRIAVAAMQQLLSTNTDAPLCLAVLLHAVTTQDMTIDLLAAADKTCASLKKTPTSLSASQVVALLLARGVQQAQQKMKTMPVHLLSWLLRSVLAHQPTEDDGDQAQVRALRSVHLVVRDLVEASASPESELLRIVKAVTPQLEQLVNADLTSELAYYHFIRVSRVVVAVHLATAVGTRDSYDVASHFERVTTHASFSARLANPAINVELLRLLATLLRAGGKELYTRELFQHLLGAYGMSLTKTDRMIRVLIDEFESVAGILASQYGYRFGPLFSVASLQKHDGSTRSDLVDDSAWFLGGALDAARVRATIERFPLDRGMDVTGDKHLLDDDAGWRTEDEGEEEDDTLSALYDPSYLMPLLARFVASSTLTDAAIAQHGVLGLALRAVSSNQEDVREFAFGILAHVHEALSADAATDFKPGRQIHLLLDTLRNGLQEPLEGVSSVITVFMNDAVAILCRPGHAMYPHLNHFLLARPALDLSDVPMFYSLFNSHSPHTFKQERSWLLHGLRRGVREDADVSLLIRRHVPSILLSFFGSELADDHTQLLVGTILVAMLETETGAAYLLSKCGFLDWIATRLLDAHRSTVSVAVIDVLASLLIASLKAPRWQDVDASQHSAFCCGAVASFQALTHVVATRGLRQHAVLRDRVAQSSTLVLTRSEGRCPLAVITAVVDNSAITLAQAEALVTPRLVLHPEFTKARLEAWSRVLCAVVRAVASTLGVAAHESGVRLDQQFRARALLGHVHDVLHIAPTLSQLVRAALADDVATLVLLL